MHIGAGIGMMRWNPVDWDVVSAGSKANAGTGRTLNKGRRGTRKIDVAGAHRAGRGGVVFKNKEAAVKP